MTTAVTHSEATEMAVEPAKSARCPLCTRSRRADRPLCNNHMRHAGPHTVERYFVRAKAARADGRPNSEANERLAAVIEQLMYNARAYDAIRGAGYRPFWHAERQEWQHPVERTREILAGWVRRHRFGLDPGNDAAVLERIAGEIHPREPRK